MVNKRKGSRVIAPLIAVALLVMLLLPLTAPAPGGGAGLLAGPGLAGQDTRVLGISFSSLPPGVQQYFLGWESRMFGGSGPTPPQPPPPPPDPVPGGNPPPPPGLTSDEALLLQLVNQERAIAGLQPLTVNMKLVAIARQKANDMIANHYFGHLSPTLGTYKDQLRAAGITGYRWAGENLAGSSSVERAHRALMNSQTHRRHILGGIYTQIGVAAVRGGPYGMMFVEDFLAP